MSKKSPLEEINFVEINFCEISFPRGFFFANANVTTFCIDLFSGLFEKWSTLDAKDFYAIPFQKLVFLISLYPEFLEKKQ